MTRRDMLLAALVAAIWGFNFVVSALILDKLPPFLFTGLRFLLVAIPAVFFIKRPTSGWRAVIGVGIGIGVVQFGLMFWAMHLGITAGLASLLIQLVTIFTVVLAVLVLKETPSRMQVIGVVVGLIGLAVIALGRDASTPFIPILMMVGAALGWASANIIMRKSGETSGLSIAVWSALVSPIPMFIAPYVVDGPAAISAALGAIDWLTVLEFIYSSTVATLASFAVWMNLMSRYPASTVAPWSLVTPPVGMVSGWLVLDEVPGAFEIVGAAVILLGVLLASIGQRRPAATRQGAPSG